MPGWLRAGLLGAACAALLACAVERPSLTPDQTIALLGTGRPLLSCREACLDPWLQAQPEAGSLLANGRWRELAILVASVGYQDDLSIYYLGRAAQGLGYRAAAVGYYRQSTELSGTSIGCAYLSRQCGGVSLPGEPAARVAALLRPALRPARGARPGLASPPPAPPPLASSPSATPSPAVSREPSESETAQPITEESPPVVPPKADIPNAAEYIEPPSASR